MSIAASVRWELDEFIRSGWWDYVLRANGWWDNNGVLKPIRRSNLPTAYQQTRLAAFDDLVASPVLYRTLLLAEDSDPNTLLNTPHHFGRYWTNDPCVAHEYRPRRCYQTDHSMPVVGIVYVVRVDSFVPEDIDWIATVGCRLTNPTLSEVRLKSGVVKTATSISKAWGFDDQLVASTPPLAGIVPVAEGPGFIENLAALNSMERSGFLNGSTPQRDR
jgi:hypothetical protein